MTDKFTMTAWAADGRSVVTVEGPIDPNRIVKKEYWTPEEERILREMRADGKTSSQIAIRLGLSKIAVQNHSSVMGITRGRE